MSSAQQFPVPPPSAANAYGMRDFSYDEYPNTAAEDLDEFSRATTAYNDPPPTRMYIPKGITHNFANPRAVRPQTNDINRWKMPKDNDLQEQWYNCSNQLLYKLWQKGCNHEQLEESGHAVEGDPRIALPLLRHQKDAVGLILHLAEETERQGILLADEQGMGKTVQIITSLMMAKRKSGRPHLLVVPSHLMEEWKAAFTDGHTVKEGMVPQNFNLKVYYDDSLPKSRELRDADCVLTTYEQIRRQYIAWTRYALYMEMETSDTQTCLNFLEKDAEDRMNPINRKCKDKRHPWNGVYFGMCEDFPLITQEWNFVALDEAHKIRNPKAKVSSALYAISLHAEFRIAATGTPIQNVYGDVASLLHFIGEVHLDISHAFFLNNVLDESETSSKKANATVSSHIDARHYIFGTIINGLSIRRRKNATNADAFGFKYIRPEEHEVKVCLDDRQPLDKWWLPLCDEEDRYPEVITEQDTQADTQAHWDKDYTDLHRNKSKPKAGQVGIGAILRNIGRAVVSASHPAAAFAYGTDYPEDLDTDDISDEEDQPANRHKKENLKTFLRLLEQDDRWKSSKNVKTISCIENDILSREPRAKVLVFGPSVVVNKTLLVGIKKTFEESMEDVKIFEIVGDMTSKKKTAAVKAYRSCPGPAIMVMSMRAGCEGLNLGCTTDVILHQIDWNPGAEAQAVSRAHRLYTSHIIHIWRIKVLMSMEMRKDTKSEIKMQKADMIDKTYHVDAFTTGLLDAIGSCTTLDAFKGMMEDITENSVKELYKAATEGTRPRKLRFSDTKMLGRK